MTLMNMPLSHKFITALSRVPDVPTGNRDRELSDVVIVGADTYPLRDFDFPDFDPETIPNGFVPDVNQYLLPEEEAYLLAGNSSLIRHNIRLAAKPKIRLCDINFGSDFLAHPLTCELLVMSSLLYAPDSDNAIGDATRQSPFVGQTEKWIEAFRNTNAIAILLMWHAQFEKDSHISRLIEQTGMYSSVVRVEDSYLNGRLPKDYEKCSYNKGAELFLHSDLA